MRTRVAWLVAAGIVLFRCGPAEENAGPQPTIFMLSVGVDGPGRVMSLPPAIDCPGVCSATFEPGTSVTLAASPLDNGMFTAWSGDCMGAMGCFVSVEGAMQVMATFQNMQPMPMPMMGLKR